MFKKIIHSLTKWYFLRNALPFWGILLIDLAIVMFAGYITEYMFLGGRKFLEEFVDISHGIATSLIFFLIAFKIFRTYAGVLRYTSFGDLRRIAAAVALGSVLSYMAMLFCRTYNLVDIAEPRFVGMAVNFTIATLLMLLVRIAVKNLYEFITEHEQVSKVFIYGVENGAVSIATGLHTQTPRTLDVVGFVSPNGIFIAKYLMGVKVFNASERLVHHMRKRGAKTLMISPAETENFKANTALFNLLMDKGIKIMILSGAQEWDGKSNLRQSQFREVEIEDLLSRDKIDVDMEAIGKMLTGKRILITGAAGSIGSEMVRQIAVYNPAEMTLIDQAETPMHDIRLMMKREYPDVNNQTIVASITDKDHMEMIFSEHRPQFVFHAAAYKHVPMMEDNPMQAVRNNINGTRIIADLAVKYGTEKFVMISTDKAVNPTNVMGCSKRICEIYCQSLNQAIVEGKVESKTQFVTTRFGNVLGSNGSVIPLFRKQIKAGGPVTVTHPEIIRYFMLIPEACKLVLEAGTIGKGGEIFVFDMGKPVKIVDLAKRMIQLSGAKNIDIKFTGLRDGEKLYEEVLNDAEGTVPTHHPKIMIAKVREYDYETARRNEDELQEIANTHDDMAIVKKMKEIVPEYKSQESKYCELDK